MPELPEVETIRRDLEKKILNKKIVDIKIKSDKSVKNSNKSFVEILKDNHFVKIDRVGKLLIFSLADKKNFLLIHLKMTGQLVFCLGKTCIVGGHSLSPAEKIPGIGDKLPGKYTRVIISFKDKSALYFNDLRKFGYLRIVQEKELELIRESFGIEPLTADFTWENLKKIFKNRRTNIKAILLNQKLVAGIGNIYADEILFASGVRPDRAADSLTESELKRIFSFSEKIIKKAIEYRGTTFNNYVDSEGKTGKFVSLLKVYGREGEKCFKCSGVIKKTKVAGRGTHSCEKCQK